MSRTNSHSAGFTMIELLLAVSLSAVVVTVFVSMLMTTFLASKRNQAQLELTGATQLALNGLERDIRYSTAYATTIASPFSDPNAPSGGWTHKGTPADANKRALILKAYATLNNPFSPTRTPIYVNGGVTNPYIAIDAQLNCSTTPPSGTLYINPQLPYMIIYFVNGTTLYRRILTDTSTTVCNGAAQYQKQSCPTGSGSPCLVKDEVVATGVTRFSINYYEQVDTSTPTFTLLDPYATSNPDDLAAADNVEIILQLQKTVGSSTVSSQLSLTVSRVNN